MGLNQEYLGLLSKAYELRYPDNLDSGYNISLSQAKLITELDSTVFKIRKGFGFKRASGEEVGTYFDHLLKLQSKILLDFNCSFGVAARDDIFKEKNFCYELRVLDNGTTVEVEYRTTGVKDDGVFDVVGLKPGK